MRNELKKNNIKEDVLFEDPREDNTSVRDAAIDTYRNTEVTTTIGALDDMDTAHAAEVEGLSDSLATFKKWAIIATIIAGLLAIALIYSIVRNIQLA